MNMHMWYYHIILCVHRLWHAVSLVLEVYVFVRGWTEDEENCSRWLCSCVKATLTCFVAWFLYMWVLCGARIHILATVVDCPCSDHCFYKTQQPNEKNCWSWRSDSMRSQICCTWWQQRIVFELNVAIDLELEGSDTENIESEALKLPCDILVHSPACVGLEVYQNFKKSHAPMLAAGHDLKVVLIPSRGETTMPVCGWCARLISFSSNALLQTVRAAQKGMFENLP